MADGFKKIPRVQVGDVSLISAEYANQLIDLLNSLGGITVSPIANVGSVKIGNAGAILDLGALDGRLRKLESMLYVNGTSSVENRLTALEAYDVYLNTRMNNASISGSGTCSGNNISINVSLNIPA